MNPLVQLAASALPGERKYILLAGAGVSKDAGVPTAWDLMLETARALYCADGCTGNPSAMELSEWFLSSKYSNMSYADLIGTVYRSSPEQQAFLAKFLNASKAGEAHGLIAELVRRNIVRAIITTNFDNYIEQALERLELPVQVISNDDDLEHSEPLIHCKAVRVYKPHGTLGRGALRNTPEDLKRLSAGMEGELVRVTSEHGLIVLGYSGSDPGMLTVLSERKPNRYPLFWVNPCKPEGTVAQLLDNRGYVYLPCSGAAPFIREYLQLVDRLTEMSPAIGHGPTLYDLEQALQIPGGPVRAVWGDFATSIFEELEATRPDFSKFSNCDDAIVDQIETATTASVRFAEAALLAGRYGNEEAAKTLYTSFGRLASLCELPESFSGTFREIDFDGFKFLTYEMLVSLVAALIRYERWTVLKSTLDEKIFVERQIRSEYIDFVHFRNGFASLDDLRNRRLQLNRVSVTSDMLKERFTKGRLAKHVAFREFANADYFLFLRTVVHEEGTTESLNFWDTWIPYGALYLDGPPSILARAESRGFLGTLADVCGFENVDVFARRVSERYGLYRKYFSRGWLRAFPFDPQRLGALR